MKPKLLYIHGLGSDRHSRKLLNLKDFFKDQYEYNFFEWNNDSDISELLNEAQKWLTSVPNVQIILVGDSTGANFAYQLREKLKQNGVKPFLILTSPLLNIENRIADFEFPKSIIPQLWKIDNPEDALIIATQNDQVLNQKLLFEKPLKNIVLIEVDDNHRLEKFHDYIHHIKDYIQLKSQKMQEN